MSRFYPIFIVLLWLGSAAQAAQETEEPRIIKSRHSPLIPLELKGLPKRVQRKGVSIHFWEQVLKFAFNKELGRNPTPAEIDLQAIYLDQLIRLLIQNFEIDESGNQTLLPLEEADFHRVRISEFNMIRTDLYPAAHLDEVSDKILCTGQYCFFPNLFLDESYLDFEDRDWIISQPKTRTGKSSIRCPNFKFHSNRTRWITIPVPVVEHDRTQLFSAHISNRRTHIRYTQLKRNQLKKPEPPAKESKIEPKEN